MHAQLPVASVPMMNQSAATREFSRYPCKAMKLTLDQFVGCMVDWQRRCSWCAYEGGPIERFVWRLLGKTSDGRMRWTDDTQMTLDLASSLLADCGVCQNAWHHALRLAIVGSRGYGPEPQKS